MLFLKIKSELFIIRLFFPTTPAFRMHFVAGSAGSGHNLGAGNERKKEGPTRVQVHANVPGAKLTQRFWPPVYVRNRK
jgi:hypothetical protein